MDTNNIIYAWLDENGDPYYVGKTKCLRQRNNDHRCKMANGNKLPKYNKLRKLLREGFKWDILIIEDGLTEEEWAHREQYWIAHYRREGCRLFNLTDGGDGGCQLRSEEEKKQMINKMRRTNEAKSDEEKELIRQRKREAQLRRNANASPEEKKKWAESKRGLKRSAETKRKISESNKGREFSKEHKEKLSIAWRKRIVTEETRRKCSETSSGRINIKKFRCTSPDGTEYVTDHGLCDFCRKHNLQHSNMVKVANGERPRHKGWICSRMERTGDN